MNYANKLGYSDITPFEVVRKVSEKCLEVREMDAELDPTWKPEFYVGGFAGHCHNQREQRWIIKANAENKVIRIRQRKDGCFYSPGGGRFVLQGAPRKFYDYNF